MNAYDIAIEVAEKLYPDEEWVLAVLGYIGCDDAVGFIVFNEFAEDYEDLIHFIGKEKADILINHFEVHCK